MHPSMREYDLVVIGSGPGGQKAAIAAAKLGKSVAVIEHRHMLGGVCTNTGTMLRRHPRIPGRCGVQLPDVRRSLQGRRAGRHEQTAHAQPIPALMPRRASVAEPMR